jgi:hypothetical protein
VFGFNLKAKWSYIQAVIGAIRPDRDILNPL